MSTRSRLSSSDLIGLTCSCGACVEFPVTLLGQSIRCHECGIAHVASHPLFDPDPVATPHEPDSTLEIPTPVLPVAAHSVSGIGLSYSSPTSNRKPPFYARPFLCGVAFLYALLLGMAHLMLFSFAYSLTGGVPSNTFSYPVLLTTPICLVIMIGSFGLVFRSRVLRILLRSGALADMFATGLQLTLAIMAYIGPGPRPMLLLGSIIMVRFLFALCLFNAASRSAEYVGYDPRVWH